MIIDDYTKKALLANNIGNTAKVTQTLNDIQIQTEKLLANAAEVLPFRETLLDFKEFQILVNEDTEDDLGRKFFDVIEVSDVKFGRDNIEFKFKRTTGHSLLEGSLIFTDVPANGDHCRFRKLEYNRTFTSNDYWGVESIALGETTFKTEADGDLRPYRLPTSDIVCKLPNGGMAAPNWIAATSEMKRCAVLANSAPAVINTADAIVKFMIRCLKAVADKYVRAFGLDMTADEKKE